MIRGCLALLVSFFLLSFLWLAGPWCSHASADAPNAEVVVVLRLDRGAARSLDEALLVERVAALAHVTVLREPEADTVLPVLGVEARGEARANVALIWPDGRRVARVVELPAEPAERVETIALVAANLLRDESAELLALLRPVEPGPHDTASPPLEAEPIEGTPLEGAVVSAPEAPTETAPDAPSVALEAPPRAPIPPSSSVHGPAFLRFGASVHFGSVPRGTGAELDVLYGLEISWTAPELLAIGVRELSIGGIANGRGVRVDLAPMVELGGTLDRFTFYGQLGVQLQLTVEDASRFGVAPLGVAGVRARIVPEMSIGLETALRVVLTEAFGTPLHELPQLSLPWTVGVAVLFHVW